MSSPKKIDLKLIYNKLMEMEKNQKKQETIISTLKDEIADNQIKQDNKISRLQDEFELSKTQQSLILSGLNVQRTTLASGPDGSRFYEPRNTFRREYPYRK